MKFSFPALLCSTGFAATLLIVLALVLPVRAMGQQVLPPAGAEPTQEHPWVPVKSIDFSSHHDVMIKNEDGSLQPMDKPHFQSTLLAPGTWQILSDGDYAYLIEGDNEALAIDSSYGAGNIREYMQTLTRKPVRFVANTHDHFDHTADNGYFDRAYMSAFTRTKATIPSATFAGIDFPRNYPVTVIGDGYVFHLGNRDIEVFEVPNHTMGDLAYLDRKSRILFSGDLFSQGKVTINVASNVARFAGYMHKLAAHRSEFDRLAGGFQIRDASTLDHYLANAEYILAGHEGEPVTQQAGAGPQGPVAAANSRQASNAIPGQIVYTRHIPHGGGGGAGPPREGGPVADQRVMNYADCTIFYDVNHVQD